MASVLSVSRMGILPISSSGASKISSRGMTEVNRMPPPAVPLRVSQVFWQGSDLRAMDRLDSLLRCCAYCSYYGVASVLLSGAVFFQFRHFFGADRHDFRAAGREGAAGRQVAQVGRAAGEYAQRRRAKFHHICAATKTLPPTTRPGVCSKRSMAMAVALFPQPDSPTSPSVSPRYTSKQILFTATMGAGATS